MNNPYSRHLYVRIWLAVVAGVVVLTLMATWLVRMAAESQWERFANVPRQVTVLDAQDRPIGRGQSQRSRSPAGQVEFDVTLDNGRELTLQVAPRPRSERERLGLRPWRSPFGTTWMIVLVGMIVALGVYPIVRRLTKRLEALQSGVQRWGAGDLAARVPEDGDDEVADLARRFNAAAQRIETLLRSHKSLLANASHELRTPLTRIRMALALGGEATSPAARFEIERNIAELDQLIEEILLASRLDATQAELGAPENLDLAGLVAEECAHTGADLDVAPGTDSNMDGVPRLLQRAVRNLLQNARRHGAGEVTARLASQGDTLVLRVEDRGPGVPPQLRERIFEPFYRLPGASEREGGVGLGLALVRTIAERHGGSVHCEAREGGGARFVLTLKRQWLQKI